MCIRDRAKTNRAAMFADNPALAGKKDYEFARGLLKRKWYDMAEKVFRELADKGENDELRKKGLLGCIEVLKKRAEDEPDPEKKKKLFNEAIKRYKDFLSGSADINAQFNLAELLKTKGKEFIDLARDEEDPKEKAKLQKEAQEAFVEAVDLIKGFVDKMEEIKEKKGGIDGLSNEEKDQAQRGSFYHAELYYEMAKIYEGSRDKKMEFLNKAIVLFEEFLWDWEEFVSAFHAYVKKGLCYLEMGQFEQAIEAYRSVIIGIDLTDARPAMLRLAEVLHKKAYFRIIEAFNRAGKFDQALREAAKLEEAFPKIIEDDALNFSDGRFALMEKAKAYAGKGEYSSAIATVMPIVKMGGGHARLAVRLLSEWGARDPTASVEVLFLQGEGNFQSQEFAKAIEAYEETIAKLTTPEEIKVFGSRTWHQIGLAYAFLGRYYEAGLAFEEGERVWGEGRKPKEGEEHWGSACAYRGYSAFKREYGISKSPFIKEVYSEKRIQLTTKYPDSKYAKNLQFFAAQDKMREDKFLEAVDLFARVDKISEFFEDAQSRIGRCFFGQYELLRKEHEDALQKSNPKKFAELKAADKLTPPEKALRYLKDSEAKLLGFIELTKTVPTTGLEHKSRRRKSLAITLFYLGRVFDERADFVNVLKYLEDFETKYKDIPDMVLPASFLRLRAFFLNKDGRGAEDMLRIVVSTDGQLRAQAKPPRKKVHIYVLIGYQLAGKLFSELSNKAKMDGETELAEEYSQKAADNLWKWIKNDPKLLGGDNVDIARAFGKLDAVGIRLFKAGEYDRAAMIYDTILRKFSEGLSDKQARLASIKLGDCYTKMENWAQGQAIYEALFEKKPSLVFIEKLVFIYTRFGDKLKKDRKEKEANQLYDKALALYGKLLKPPKPEKRDWWSWKLDVWNIMFKKGNFKEIVEQIKKIKMMYPELGGTKNRKGILEIEKQAKEKAR